MVPRVLFRYSPNGRPRGAHKRASDSESSMASKGFNYSKWDHIDDDTDEEEDVYDQRPPFEQVPPGEATKFEAKVTWSNVMEAATVKVFLPEKSNKGFVHVLFEERFTVIRLNAESWDGKTRSEAKKKWLDMKLTHPPIAPRKCYWDVSHNPTHEKKDMRCWVGLALAKVTHELWPMETFGLGDLEKPRSKDLPQPPPGTLVLDKTAEAVAAMPPPEPEPAAPEADPVWGGSEWSQEGACISLFFPLPSYDGVPPITTKDVSVKTVTRKVTISVKGVGTIEAHLARPVVPDETVWMFADDIPPADNKHRVHYKNARMLRVDLAAESDDQWTGSPFDESKGGGFTPTPEYLAVAKRAEKEAAA